MRMRTFFWCLTVGFAVTWAAPIATQVPGSSAHERGEALYQRHCAACHGVDGGADTPAGRLLEPRPRDFSDPVDMARVTYDRMYHAIKNGRPGTAMAPWGKVLTEIEIGDLIDYILVLNRSAPTLSSEQLSLEVGRRLYEQSCAVCHGVKGEADTEAARVLHPAPRKFADPVEMARVDDGRMYLAIKVGRRGTGMASWEHILSPAEIIDVMRYIRTLEQPLPASMTQSDVDLIVGGQIYEHHCVACHGEKGKGNTPLGQALHPPPRDFTSALAMSSLSDEDLARTIIHGKPGTAMAPWQGVLNAEDVRRVIFFIRQSFSPES